jgi:nucleotide-binding universal stress UspA family protein
VKIKQTPSVKKSAASRLKRILVPVDFSPASNLAVEYARRVRGFTGAELIFLHVIVPDAPPGTEDLPAFCSDDSKENAGDRLRAFVRASRNNARHGARSIVRCGLPTHEIVEEAKDSNVDLIVIGSHGYTGWKHFCIGSTAERVVRAAPCSVSVVRQKEVMLE